MGLDFDVVINTYLAVYLSSFYCFMVAKPVVATEISQNLQNTICSSACCKSFANTAITEEFSTFNELRQN